MSDGPPTTFQELISTATRVPDDSVVRTPFTGLWPGSMSARNNDLWDALITMMTLPTRAIPTAGDTISVTQTTDVVLMRSETHFAQLSRAAHLATRDIERRERA